jgi:hypothetical protein
MITASGFIGKCAGCGCLCDARERLDFFTYSPSGL